MPQSCSPASPSTPFCFLCLPRGVNPGRIPPTGTLFIPNPESAPGQRPGPCMVPSEKGRVTRPSPRHVGWLLLTPSFLGRSQLPWSAEKALEPGCWAGNLDSVTYQLPDFGQLSVLFPHLSLGHREGACPLGLRRSSQWTSCSFRAWNGARHWWPGKPLKIFMPHQSFYF